MEMGPGTIASVALFVAVTVLPLTLAKCPGDRSPQPIWWRCPPPVGQQRFTYYQFTGEKMSASDTTNLDVPALADFNTTCLRGYLAELAIAGPFVARGNLCFPPQACTARERYIITAKSHAGGTFKGCPELSVTRGVVSYPNDRRYYANAKIICPEGYVLDSQKPVFCEHDGKWLHAVPDGQKVYKAETFKSKACIACLSPPEIQNGNIASCPGKETAEIQCNDGYTFSGRSTALQFIDTHWTNPKGFCREQCPASQEIENGFLRTSNVRVNSTAKVVCDQNFSINGNGLAICKIGGNWSIAGTCERQCPALVEIENGFLRISNVRVNSTAKVVCDKYFSINGNDLAICKIGGNWSIAGACEMTLCQNLTSPQNGMVSDGSNEIYAVRTFTCQVGFQLKGRNETSCVSGLHGPEWLPDTPECVLNSCQNLTNPKNGMSSSGRNEIYSVREFTCKDGFQLKGSNRTSCVTGKHGPEWIPNTPECVPVHCQIPVDMTDHVYIITGTSVNSTLTISCKRGTIAAGRPAVCGANGNWSDLRLTYCDDTSTTIATPATPVKSVQGDVLGFSGSIALIVIIACLVVAIVLLLVVVVVLRRMREYKPSQENTEMQPVPKKKASKTNILQDGAASSRQRLDQWEDDTYNTLGGSEVGKATEKTTAPPTGDSDNADLYDHLVPEKDGATGAPQAGRESLSEQQKDALIPGEVYSTVADTTGGSKSLYENTIPKEVSASPRTPADVAPPAAAIGDDTGGLYTTVVFTSKKKETAQSELGAGAEQGESHPFVSAANPETIYTTVSLKTRK